MMCMIVLYCLILYYIFSLTKSPGENIITGQVYGQSFNGASCRVWTQIFDCKDGSFIMRYKVFNTCFNVKIKVKIKEKELLVSHSKIKGIGIFVYCRILYYLTKTVFRSCL